MLPVESDVLVWNAILILLAFDEATRPAPSLFHNSESTCSRRNRLPGTCRAGL